MTLQELAVYGIITTCVVIIAIKMIRSLRAKPPEDCDTKCGNCAFKEGCSKEEKTI